MPVCVVFEFCDLTILGRDGAKITKVGSDSGKIFGLFHSRTTRRDAIRSRRRQDTTLNPYLSIILRFEPELFH